MSQCRKLFQNTEQTKTSCQLGFQFFVISCFTNPFFLPFFKNAWIPIRLHFSILAKLLLRLEKQLNLQIAVIRENFSI